MRNHIFNTWSLQGHVEKMTNGYDTIRYDSIRYLVHSVALHIVAVRVDRNHTARLTIVLIIVIARIAIVIAAHAAQHRSAVVVVGTMLIVVVVVVDLRVEHHRVEFAAFESVGGRQRVVVKLAAPTNGTQSKHHQKTKMVITITIWY